MRGESPIVTPVRARSAADADVDQDALGMRHASFLGMLLPCRAFRKNHHVPIWSGGSPVLSALLWSPS
jgi:hypothetical protein